MTGNIHHIAVDGENFQYWYDRGCRCWFAAHVDELGNLGATIDAYSRPEIIRLIKLRHVEIGGMK